MKYNRWIEELKQIFINYYKPSRIPGQLASYTKEEVIKMFNFESYKQYYDYGYTPDDTFVEYLNSAD